MAFPQMSGPSGTASSPPQPPSWQTRSLTISTVLRERGSTSLSDKYVFGLQVAVVDIFIEEVGAALGKLEEQRDGLLLMNVAVLLKMVFKVAE